MTTNDTTKHTGPDPEDRLKHELRSLPKMKAPWFFEAELQRRLREGAGEWSLSRWVARPVPAYAFSMLGIVAVGVFAYLFMIQTPATDQMRKETSVGLKDAATSSEQIVQPTPYPVPQTQQELQPAINESPGRGPSTGSADALIEARIETDRLPTPRSRTKVVELAPSQDVDVREGIGPAAPQQMQRSANGLSYRLDSMTHRAAKDSLDSLKNQLDSLSKTPKK